MVEQISVEIVFAKPDRQLLLRLSVPKSTTVAVAIDLSGIGEHLPEDPIDSLPVGVWGHPVSRHHVLEDHDRIEIYRPLSMDPRTARRLLAQAGKTMGSGKEPPGR